MKAEGSTMNEGRMMKGECARVRRPDIVGTSLIHRSSFRIQTSDGYAFVVLMVAMTVMLIALAAALPSVYHESQREKEEELIFRGNEYARAIYLFQRQFQRYPKSVDELIRTNNIRFLRHAYKDPMSSDGKWRFIHVIGNGTLVDSLTMGPQQQPQFVGASGQSAPVSSQSSPFSDGSNGAGSVTSQQPSNGSNGAGSVTFQPSSNGSNGIGPGTSQQPSNAESQSSSMFGQSQEEQKAAKEAKIRAACEGKSDSAFFTDNQVQGALIAGVASCSKKTSIRIWNKKTKYEEWEFLGVAFQPSAFPGVPQPQQQPQPGQGGLTNQPGQGAGVGQSGVGAGGQGSTPPGVQQPQNPPQNPPDAPLTDQPAPDQPGNSPESQDNPPQR
jgi:type II secretory pathway pseudopilin PulG